MANKKYTQIAVTPLTQKKISILATVVGPSIVKLAEAFTDAAWEKAKKEGLVTDAMIGLQDQHSPSKQKKSAVTREIVTVA